MRALIVLAMLAGCMNPSQYVPSLQHCHTVSYERIGSKMHVEADCLVPAGIVAQ